MNLRINFSNGKKAAAALGEGKFDGVREFDRFLDHLCGALGHADRHMGLKDYCHGLMSPTTRKTVGCMASVLDPLRSEYKQQTLHHFVADSEWSDRALLDRVQEWVLPALGVDEECYWAIDDHGHPRHGNYSAGVTYQYCRNLGKETNCQVAVTLSLATRRGSIPIDYRLYLPGEWVNDAARRTMTGIPSEHAYATKSEIALAQLQKAIKAGISPGIVLAEADYGNDADFRNGISALGLSYVIGIDANTCLSPTVGKVPPQQQSESSNQALPTAMDLAKRISPYQYQDIAWLDGANETHTSRFGCLRVVPARRNHSVTDDSAEEWLLIEWPAGHKNSSQFWLATLPTDTPLEQIALAAKMRKRVEHDHRELEQRFGLFHYVGRGWLGFHHHATLCIAAHGFLTAYRLAQGTSKINLFEARPNIALPKALVSRGRPPGRKNRNTWDAPSAVG